MRELGQNPFVYGGALTKKDRRGHVIREAEGEVIRLLRVGRFVQLAEPRQQGKTSLISRLGDVLSRSCIIHVTASDYDPEKAGDWYALIGNLICKQARSRVGVLPRGSNIEPPVHRNQWSEFLTQLATT